MLFFFMSPSFLPSQKATAQVQHLSGARSMDITGLVLGLQLSSNIHWYPPRYWELCWDPDKAMDKTRSLPSESSQSGTGWVTNREPGPQGGVCGSVCWDPELLQPLGGPASHLLSGVQSDIPVQWDRRTKLK